MGSSRLYQSSFSSIEVGFYLCLASKLLLPLSMPREEDLWPGEFLPRCEASVQQTPDLPTLVTRHRAVARCNYLLPRAAHSGFQRSSRADPTMLIQEPGFFEVFSKSFPAKSSCVPGGDPSFAANTLIHCLAPLFQAEFDAPVITQGCLLKNRPVVYP